MFCGQGPHLEVVKEPNMVPGIQLGKFGICTAGLAMIKESTLTLLHYFCKSEEGILFIYLEFWATLVYVQDSYSLLWTQ